MAHSNTQKTYLDILKIIIIFVSDPQEMLRRESELLYLTFNCVNLEKLTSLGFNLYIYKILQNVNFCGPQSFLSLAFTPMQPLPWNVGWTEMLLLIQVILSWEPSLAVF